MKQTRRHELKQNELAHSLTELKEWLNKYVNYVIGAAVAVVAIIGIGSYSSKQRNEKFERGWADYQAAIDDYAKAAGTVGRGANASIPSNPAGMDQALKQMQLVADTYADNGDLTARSLLWIGDQALRQLATVQSGPSEGGSLQLLGQAEKAYERVTMEFKDRPLDVAIAKFGLAAIAEERGQFDQAKKMYEEMSQWEGAELLPMANLAKVKLEEVDNYAKPVTFAAPPTPRLPTTQPLTELIIPPAPTSPTSAPTTQPAIPASAPSPTTQPASP
jgi:tetratricopeptide (TPR) repeat protein